MHPVKIYHGMFRPDWWESRKRTNNRIKNQQTLANVCERSSTAQHCYVSGDVSDVCVLVCHVVTEHPKNQTKTTRTEVNMKCHILREYDLPRVHEVK